MINAYYLSSSITVLPSLSPPFPLLSSLPCQDEETTFSTNRTNLLHSNFQLTPVSSIIGPKAEVIPSSGTAPTEQPPQQAPPLSHAHSVQHNPQPINHPAPPNPLQQVVQPQYSEADQHSWYYKDPQSNVQGKRMVQRVCWLELGRCGLVGVG